MATATSSDSPQPLIIRGRIIADVNVTIDSSSVSLLQCVVCGKVRNNRTGPTAEKPKRCSRCRAVIYCGKQCQEKDWTEGKHKAWCKLFDKHIITCRKLVKQLRHCPMDPFDPTDLDYFDKENGAVGRFYDFFLAQDYCQFRLRIVHVMMREATQRFIDGNAKSSDGRCNSEKAPRVRINRLALEMALEHCLDMLYLSMSDDQQVRCIVPSAMIGLGKYQEAYDFVKYWFVKFPLDCEKTSRKSTGKIEREDVDDPYATFLHLKGENIFEPVELLGISSQSNAGMILDLALVKFLIYQQVRGIQTMNNALIENQDLSRVIAAYDDIPAEWVHLESRVLLRQTRELLSRVHELNEFILPGMLDPAPPPRMKSGCPGQAPPSGTKEEASFVLDRSLFAWQMNPFAMKFLAFFVSNLETESIPVPRDDAMPRAEKERLALGIC